MRILYVTCYYKPAYVYGGPARSIPLMCEGLARAGAEVRVVTTDANGTSRLDVPPNRPATVDGVQVWYQPLVLGSPLFYASGLAIQVRQQVGWADIVISENLWEVPAWQVHHACRSHARPYVVPLRGQLLPWSLSQKRLKKALHLRLWGYRYLNAAAAIWCTDEMEAQAARGLGLKPHILIAPNCVDLSSFSTLPPAGRFRARCGIPQSAWVLIFCGRLHPKKNPHIPIAALSALLKNGVDAHLIVAGPDELGLLPELRQLAGDLGCSTRVHFTGLLSGEEIYQALADADLFLMPSAPDSENFGMAAVEALAAGVPVLVSEGVPVGRWAAQAGAGRVIPPDRRSFEEAVVEMYGYGEQVLKEMGARGCRLVKEQFSQAAVAQRALAQLESIAGAGRGVRERTA